MKPIVIDIFFLLRIRTLHCEQLQASECTWSEDERNGTQWNAVGNAVAASYICELIILSRVSWLLMIILYQVILYRCLESFQKPIVLR